MKPFAALALAVAAAAGPTSTSQRNDPAAILAAAPLCHGAAPTIPSAALTVAPVLVAGLGDAGFAPEGVSPAAAPYFMQGARLTHAFNAPEAIHAFAWAQRIDPACALCAWGEAWARGPTINYPVDAAEAGRARAAAGRAGALADRQALSPQARGLIAAVAARYPSGLARSDDAAYADAMEALQHRFPQDDPISVETASALLIASGQAWSDLSHEAPNPRVRRARSLLETVLARSPRYTPAIHFDIHLMEWTGEPQKAVAAADTLGVLAPAAGHLVHMPSHLYYRLGRYDAAAAANARAVAADRAYVRQARPPGGLAAFALHAHNLSFGLAGAFMDGDGAAARAFARDIRATFGEGCDLCARAWFADARYAPVGEVLAAKAPADPLPRALWRYARGESLARAGRGGEVAAEARAIALQQPAAKDGVVEIARLVLEGRAHILAGRPAAAVAPLRRAADLRDALDQRPDPPSWPFPPRRTLGAALLLAGDARGAERELAASLRSEPRDGLALFALSRAQRRLGERGAEATLAQAKLAWKGDPAAFRLEML